MLTLNNKIYSVSRVDCPRCGLSYSLLKEQGTIEENCGGWTAPILLPTYSPNYISHQDREVPLPPGEFYPLKKGGEAEMINLSNSPLVKMGGNWFIGGEKFIWRVKTSGYFLLQAPAHLPENYRIFSGGDRGYAEKGFLQPFTPDWPNPTVRLCSQCASHRRRVSHARGRQVWRATNGTCIYGLRSQANLSVDGTTAHATGWRKGAQWDTIEVSQHRVTITGMGRFTHRAHSYAVYEGMISKIQLDHPEHDQVISHLRKPTEGIVVFTHAPRGNGD